MATAVPKSTEKASVDLFEGLQTSSLNLPIAPSHPILLTSTSETSPFLGKNELVQVENDKANHEKKAKLTINDSNNAGFAKLSKLYTSEDDIQRRSDNSYPTLPSLQPSRSLPSAAMPMFSTYLPQPHSSSPLKTEDEEESGIASESASLLPQKAIQGSAVSGSSMAPPPAGTRAVSSSYHLPQAQTPTQAPVNRLNPSLAYLPNSVAYSAPTIQRIAPSNIEATDRALVEELVNENLRLNQEVQSLHAIIAMTPTETMHLNNSNPSILQNTYSSQMIQQHPPMQQQFREPPPAGRVLGTIVQPGQRNMSQSIAPFAVSSPSPTMNPMTTGMSHETSSSSSSRSGRITNGVYRPLSTSSSNEIELQDRHSFSRTTADTSTAPSAPSQTPVANTGEGTMTSNAANQTKYLCCGGCRQWLSCPFDAELVYCPTCQSVNSCPRPATTRPQVSYRDANGNLVQAESFEWYAPLLPFIDCVRNLVR